MMHRARGTANAVNADGCQTPYIPQPTAPLFVASPPSSASASCVPTTGRDADSVLPTHVPVMGAWQHNPYSLEYCYEKAQYGDDYAITPRTPSSLLSSSSFGSNDFAAAGVACLCTRCVAEAAFKTSRGPRSEKAWVRISGLSYTTSAHAIQELFLQAGLAFAEYDSDPVTLLLFSGRPSGRAVVHMQSEQEAARAAEMFQGYEVSEWRIECQQVSLASLLAELQRMARRQAKWMPGSVAPVGVDTSMQDPRAFVPAVLTGCCLKLVGFAPGTTEANVIAFLHPYRVQPDSVHLQTRYGKFTGSCVAVMADGLEALRAVTRKHRQYLGRRYIEVYPARPCDLHCDVAELKNVVRFVVDAPISSGDNNRVWWDCVAPLFEGLHIASVDACAMAPEDLTPAGNNVTDSGLPLTQPVAVVFASFITSAVARNAVRRCVKAWERQSGAIVDFAESNCHDDDTVEVLINEAPSMLRLCGPRPRVCTLWERSDTLRQSATGPVMASQSQPASSTATTRTTTPDPQYSPAQSLNIQQEVTHLGAPTTHWRHAPQHTQQGHSFTQFQAPMPYSNLRGTQPTYTHGSASLRGLYQ